MTEIIPLYLFELYAVGLFVISFPESVFNYKKKSERENEINNLVHTHWHRLFLVELRDQQYKLDYKLS